MQEYFTNKCLDYIQIHDYYQKQKITPSMHKRHHLFIKANDRHQHQLILTVLYHVMNNVCSPRAVMLLYGLGINHKWYTHLTSHMDTLPCTASGWSQRNSSLHQVRGQSHVNI